MRDLAEVVPLEECMCSRIVLPALEENPAHVASPRLGFDRGDHARAGAARSQCRIDGEVRKYREAYARRFDPFDDRRGDDLPVGTAHQQKPPARIRLRQVLGKQCVEIVCPVRAVGAQPALDLAMADIARIQPYDAGEEGGRRSAVGGALRPDRIAFSCLASGHGAGASAHKITLCGQVPISVHCMCWPTHS